MTGQVVTMMISAIAAAASSLCSTGQFQKGFHVRTSAVVGVLFLLAIYHSLYHTNGSDD